MTLYDFGSLIRHYWKAVVSIPVICAIAAGAFFFFSEDKQYRATSSIFPYELAAKVSSSNVASVVSLLANEYVADNEYSGVSVKTNNGNTSNDPSSVSITVTRSNPDECIALANEICKGVAQYAEEYYAELEEDYLNGVREDNSNSMSSTSIEASSYVIVDNAKSSDSNLRYYVFHTSDATSAEVVGSNAGKWTIVAFFGALFATVCFLVLLDLIRRPINQSRAVEATFGIPLLNGFTKSKTGEDTWANLRFIAGPDIESICLIPLASLSAEVAGGQLVQAIEASGQSVQAKKCDTSSGVTLGSSSAESGHLEVLECPSISQGMAGAYIARNASATVVCARAWKDTLDDLQRTLRELELAEVSPAGLILVG